jgi:Chaperone of endosialidase
MAVPYTFGNATTSIPLSQLDSNFATAITIGNTAVYLGNTTTSFGNVTLNNVTIASGNATVTKITAPTHDAGSGNALTLQSNSTTAIYVDTSQNVGIGTSSPALPLHVYNATAALAYFETTNTAGPYTIWRYSGTSIGDVGSLKGVTGSGNATDFIISSRAGIMAFGTGSTERMRIDTSGNVLVGTTNVSDSSGVGIKLQFSSSVPEVAVVGTSTSSGSTGYTMYSTGASAYRFYVDYAGTIHATSTSITAISDQSLKTNVKPLETGLAEVMRLQPRRFDWIDQTKTEGTNIAGFIAQEVEQVLSDLVVPFKYDETETKLGLKMGDMIPTLVKAIQELSAKVDAQAAEITALKAKVGA